MEKPPEGGLSSQEPKRLGRYPNDYIAVTVTCQPLNFIVGNARLKYNKANE